MANHSYERRKSTYDLEDRTLAFAKRVRDFVRRLPKTIANIEYGKQLIRCSASVGANYIEANEALSRKDFLLRVKISKKEAKESSFFLRLVETSGNPTLGDEREELIRESYEFGRIFGSIVVRSQPS